MKYELLDSGNRMKLEQVGKYRLVRPALNAAWTPSLPQKEWDSAVGIFERNSSGGGKWSWSKGGVPESWITEWGGYKLVTKATNFGHLGFFAEQHANWQWLREQCRKLGPDTTTLNLFAYSGIASMAMAEGGANVTHLDAAKGMNDWGKENQQLNAMVPDKIRWIADDVIKFTSREIRRENKYNGIVLDPPSFGRGTKGQVWKLEDSVIDLLENCNRLLDKSRPYFVLLSCHSPGFSPIVLERLIKSVICPEAKLESGEMTVPDINGNSLPAGIYARAICRTQ